MITGNFPYSFFKRKMDSCHYTLRDKAPTLTLRTSF
jgi:hypothetical protein